MFNYKKLKLKIKEVFDTQENFAKALNLDPSALNARLNNVTQWRSPDIVKACELLGIPLEEVHAYFFVEKL